MIKVILLAVFEVLKAMVFKVAFKHVFERFVTRLVLWGGDKLVGMTTNTLDDKTWIDIKTELSGRRLKVVDDVVRESYYEAWSE